MFCVGCCFWWRLPGAFTANRQQPKRLLLPLLLPPSVSASVMCACLWVNVGKTCVAMTDKKNRIDCSEKRLIFTVKMIALALERTIKILVYFMPTRVFSCPKTRKSPTCFSYTWIKSAQILFFFEVSSSYLLIACFLACGIWTSWQTMRISMLDLFSPGEQSSVPFVFPFS